MPRFVNLKRTPLSAIDTAEGDSISVGGCCEFGVSEATAALPSFKWFLKWLRPLPDIQGEDLVEVKPSATPPPIPVPAPAPESELDTSPTDSPGLLVDPRTGAESADAPSHDAQDPSEEDVVADVHTSGEAEQSSGEDSATSTKRKSRKADRSKPRGRKRKP